MTALKPSSESKASGIEARCAATGMRMTEQRRVIARVLAEAVDHPDVEELYRRCVAVDDKISILDRVSHRQIVRGCGHHRAP
ncbi:Fe2+ or Zn2+ uptake regulation protein [Bradyrhizobium sp. LM3.2]